MEVTQYKVLTRFILLHYFLRNKTVLPVIETVIVSQKLVANGDN